MKAKCIANAFKRKRRCTEGLNVEGQVALFLLLRGSACPNVAGKHRGNGTSRNAFDPMRSLSKTIWAGPQPVWEFVEELKVDSNSSDIARRRIGSLLNMTIDPFPVA